MKIFFQVGRYFLLIFLFSYLFFIFGRYEYFFIFFQTLVLLLFTLRRTELSGVLPEGVRYPMVSVIVPMRNEEKNVEACLRSIYSIDYPNFEIIVGDDSSDDGTLDIIRNIVSIHSVEVPTKLVDIPKIPDGWTGKAWAVHCLIRRAKGEIFLVVDADVRHSTQSLRHSVAHFLNTKADLMVRSPYPIADKIGEWQIVFFLFTLRFSTWFSSHILGLRQAVAKEEYTMFSRKCLDDLGGYEQFRDDYPMILSAMNAAFDSGKNVVVLDDDTIEVSARMYEGFWGTTKGIFERINIRPIRFYSLLGIFAIIYFSTNGVYSAASSLFIRNLDNFLFSLANYTIFTVFFGSYLFLSKQPLKIAPFGPILGFWLILLSLFAVLRTIFNMPLHWRGRTIHIR